MKRYIFLLIILLSCMNGFSQSAGDSITLQTKHFSKDSILLTPDAASGFIHDLLNREMLWRNNADSTTHSLRHLLYHFEQPYDSTASWLEQRNYDSVTFKLSDFISYDSLAINWLNDSTFILDTIVLEKSPFKEEIKIVENERHLDVLFRDSLPDLDAILDSVFQEPDTLVRMVIDSLYLDSTGLTLFEYSGKKIAPSPILKKQHRSYFLTKDSTSLVLTDTTWHLVASENSPFYIVPNEQITDSLLSAIDVLLDYNMRRDSIPIFINDINGTKTPFWLGLGNDIEYRYWVKNYKNDSITIWVGNPSRNNISVYLEDDVQIDRMTKKVIDDIPIIEAVPETKLVEITPLKKIPKYWEYDFSSLFSFSQTAITQWAEGGQNALTSMMDIKGEAAYTNSKINTKWTSSARLKYGSIYTREDKLRTNLDMLVLNSQYNKKIKGKFDFSATFYFKTQVSKGKSYPNDTTELMISKFLNPATFTIGLGSEYKPFKNTQLNFAPLSYKNTFVLDTTGTIGVDAIDPTKYGIDADKLAKQELGSQLVIKNKLDILNGLEINNNIRLFTSYFAKPVSVDMDWEVNLKKKITWFFSVSANLHMIYDRDILFAVKDDDGNPVLNTDGSALKEPKLQFKEFIGLSFSMNF